MFIDFLVSTVCFLLATLGLRIWLTNKSLVMLVSLALPVLALPLTFWIASASASCTGAECGPLIMVGAGIFAALVTAGGLVGAGLAAIAHRFWRQRHDRGAKLTRRFTDLFVNRQYRFSLGHDSETGSYYLSTPITKDGLHHLVEYEAYYRIDDMEFARFRDDPASAVEFIEICRRNGHRARLID